jgi:tetratricopeptide (TPR) repeat protein
MTTGAKTKGKATPGLAAIANRKPTLSPSIVSAPAVASRTQLWVVSGLLAVTTVLVYARAGGHPFVDYDDQAYVVNNDHVRAGLSWETLSWAVTATEQSNWHPLTWLSHALDCQLFGLNAAGHHWTSILLHALNVALLFLLLARATGALGRSLVVAALFALHPLNVESAAWIAERKNVLSTLLFFLALGAYGWYARQPSVRRYLVVTLLFLLGLAAKPMVITLPFVLLLVDLWPLGRIAGWSHPSTAFPVEQRTLPQLILEKLPLLAVCVASAVITVIAQGASVIPTVALPLAVRLETALYAYTTYLWKMIWPGSLALVYPHPGRSLIWWQPLLGAALITIVSFAAWKQRCTRPYFAAGWLWFLGTLVPVIGIVQVGVQVVADRYAYVPLIGIFVIVVWGAVELADHFRVGVVPRAAFAALIVAVLAFVTWRQIGYWDSTVDLWTHALQVTKDNSIAENGLATVLFRMGRYEEGIVHLRNYARLEPLDPEAHARVGADFQDHGQLDDARREYEAAIRGSEVLRKAGLPSMDTAELAVTYANLGAIYGAVGDRDKARENAQQALRIDAQAVDQMMGQLARAIAARPTAQGCVRLGLLLQQVGLESDAQQAFARALQLDPKFVLPPITGPSGPR